MKVQSLQNAVVVRGGTNVVRVKDGSIVKVWCHKNKGNTVNVAIDVAADHAPRWAASLNVPCYVELKDERVKPFKVALLDAWREVDVTKQ